MLRYSADFKDQALRKVFARHGLTIHQIADDLHLNLGTLKNWMKQHRKSGAVSPRQTPLSAAKYSLAQRLDALNESFGLDAEALNAWCRTRGLFPAQLQQWREEFIGTRTDNPVRTQSAELRDLKTQNIALSADIRRKDAALAETAALLVLKKKFQALFSDEA
jgi:transposase-like protein